MSPKRRPHGEGALYQLADGRWRGVIDINPWPDGRRRQRTVYGKTEGEARVKLEAVKAGIPAVCPCCRRPYNDRNQ